MNIIKQKIVRHTGMLAENSKGNYKQEWGDIAHDLPIIRCLIPETNSIIGICKS